MALAALAVGVAGFEFVMGASITDPCDDIADGFAEELMPTDYAQELGTQRIRALAAFIAAASGEEDEDDEQSGKGRGRSGRG